MNIIDTVIITLVAILVFCLAGCGGKVSNASFEAARGFCVANEGLSYIHTETVDNTFDVECNNGARTTLMTAETP